MAKRLIEHVLGSEERHNPREGVGDPNRFILLPGTDFMISKFPDKCVDRDHTEAHRRLVMDGLMGATLPIYIQFLNELNKWACGKYNLRNGYGDIIPNREAKNIVDITRGFNEGGIFNGAYARLNCAVFKERDGLEIEVIEDIEGSELVRSRERVERWEGSGYFLLSELSAQGFPVRTYRNPPTNSLCTYHFDAKELGYIEEGSREGLSLVVNSNDGIQMMLRPMRDEIYFGTYVCQKSDS